MYGGTRVQPEASVPLAQSECDASRCLQPGTDSFDSAFSFLAHLLNDDPTSVSVPIFDASENEDVFEFLDKFKRAAALNGWNDDDLPIGLPLYLKGHASAWFKCLQGANEMTFDELSTAMINQLASRVSGVSDSP